eukprot:1162018-Pelagomonas_calceolata.AAC.18
MKVEDKIAYSASFDDPFRQHPHLDVISNDLVNSTLRAEPCFVQVLSCPHAVCRQSLDYTVAHYGIVTQDPRLDAVLCFVAEQEGNTAWDDGEVRGAKTPNFLEAAQVRTPHGMMER